MMEVYVNVEENNQTTKLNEGYSKIKREAIRS